MNLQDQTCPTCGQPTSLKDRLQRLAVLEEIAGELRRLQEEVDALRVALAEQEDETT